CARGVIFDFW
nr:immunoglobulin heavy chain junction region [Macaca mulatta]MOW87249.1 immunoglobulin heavy chain junction region [Macaca mulatta]MOW87915.1 immunoglobulin heavy chain junction region [Macaca mulatta]MOW89482.1 immunoglobulin heavy chain junction region [Macaca mulatta]MOW91034.1 immunoglobulin heavy chain junction region [Macaca mulatta]